MTPDLSAAVPVTYVFCVYDNDWFLGNVIETSEESEAFLVYLII